MQVAVDRCMKLQMIRAKASQGAGEKHRAVERKALWAGDIPAAKDLCHCMAPSCLI